MKIEEERFKDEEDEQFKRILVQILKDREKTQF